MTTSEMTQYMGPARLAIRYSCVLVAICGLMFSSSMLSLSRDQPSDTETDTKVEAWTGGEGSPGGSGTGVAAFGCDSSTSFGGPPGGRGAEYRRVQGSREGRPRVREKVSRSGGGH